MIRWWPSPPLLLLSYCLYYFSQQVIMLTTPGRGLQQFTPSPGVPLQPVSCQLEARVVDPCGAVIKAGTSVPKSLLCNLVRRWEASLPFITCLIKDKKASSSHSRVFVCRSSVGGPLLNPPVSPAPCPVRLVFGIVGETAECITACSSHSDGCLRWMTVHHHKFRRGPGVKILVGDLPTNLVWC